MKQLWLVAMAAVLAACGGESTPGPTAQVDITGDAYYMERIMMPPGSVLEIELIDEVSGERLATERMEDVGAPPYPFGLRVDQELISPEGEYLLQLTLYLPDGAPRFAAEIPVTRDQTHVSRIRLVGVDYSEQDPDPEPMPAEWHSFQCGDIAVDASFDADARVSLSLPWKLVELPLVRAASGARFADDEIEFWTRGSDQARLTLPDEETFECILRDSLSPWTRAMIDGVDFRAVGNEPGWHVEVMHDEGLLFLTLDYGTNRLEFEDVEVLADQAGYRAESPGNEVEITIEHATCQDSMVGWPFPVRVEMRLNDLELQACGRFLGDG